MDYDKKITDEMIADKQANTDAANAAIEEHRNIDSGVDSGLIDRGKDPLFEILNDARTNKDLQRRFTESKREELKNIGSELTDEMITGKQANTDAANAAIEEHRNIDSGVDSSLINRGKDPLFEILDDARTNKGLQRRFTESKREELKNIGSELTDEMRAGKQANTDAANAAIEEHRNIDSGADSSLIDRGKDPLFEILNDARTNKDLQRRFTESKREELKNIGSELTDEMRAGKQANTETANASNMSFKTPTGEDISISLVYESVAENTLPIADAINGTAVFDNDKHQSCLSESKYPASLNGVNDYLFSASSDLLTKVGNDVKNIASVLTNYSYLENNLAAYTEYLDGNNGWYGVPTDYEIPVHDTSSYRKLLLDSFDTINIHGNIGKMVIHDIDEILNSASPLIKSLENEENEALQLKKCIDDLIKNADFIDPVWNKMVDRLNAYSDLCRARADATITLKEAYMSSSKLIQDYYDETKRLLVGSKINMNGVLDDGQIPVCENTIAQLKQEIAELEVEYTTCEAVPSMRGTGRFFTAEDGKKYEEMEPNEPEYTNARNRMKEIKNVIIPEKNADIDYNNTYIERLNGVTDVMNAANALISDAIANVGSTYVSKLNNPIISITDVGVIDI